MAWLQRLRRAEILRHPFPPEWREILARNVPAVAKLDTGERATLEDKVRIFLAEKNLEGCGGLDLTDEIRVTIAAQACLLLLNRRTDYFPNLREVLVYPDRFVVDRETASPSGLVTRKQQILSGPFDKEQQ